MHNILIVADGDLKKVGRYLVHVISRGKAAKASLNSSKQYGENEHQLTGDQLVIFLGINDVSRDFLPMIQVKYENHGIKWGYDATKAIIFLDESFEVDENKLEDEIKKLNKEIIVKKTKKDGIYGTGMAGDFMAPLVASLLSFTTIGKLINLVLENNIKEVQYSLGITTFLKDGFNDFLKIEKID